MNAWITCEIAFIHLLLLARIFRAGGSDEKQGRLSTEGRLIKKLLNKNHYENRSRPVRNASKPLDLNVSFSLFQIIDVDDRHQTVTVAAYLDVFWRDENIHWNPVDYDGIHVLVVPSVDVWVPDFGLINSVDGDFDFSRDNSRRVQITHEGGTLWSPGGIYRVGCSLYMAYFPFDRHRCKLTFSFWLHNAQLIRAKTMTDEAITALYVPNGQWELEQTEVTDRIISTIGNESDPTTMVSHLFVHIQMRRKPGFYIMNVILPCISISFLVLTLFYLPCDSGEKVSLGITVLLAFSVFQLAVADTMPRAFHSAPVILIYLSTLMGMATISTAQAVFVLNIHHMDGDRAMPTWFRRFVFCYLTKMICRKHDFADFAPENVVHCEQDGMNHTDYHNSILHKTRENGGIFEITEERSGKLDGIFKVLELMYRDMCKFYKRIEERDNSDRARKEWKAAAKVIDRCFILVYFFVSTAFTFSCLVIAPSIGAYEVPNMFRDKPW